MSELIELKSTIEENFRSYIESDVDNVGLLENYCKKCREIMLDQSPEILLAVPDQIASVFLGIINTNNYNKINNWYRDDIVPSWDEIKDLLTFHNTYKEFVLSIKKSDEHQFIMVIIAMLVVINEINVE